MTKFSEIALSRLRNQRLAGVGFERAEDVVRWFGAVQGQDFLFSLWGLGLRVPGSTEAKVERAVDEGSIIRTWPMRGTIHYVPAEDARWMLDLMTPRIISGASKHYRDLSLDEQDFDEAREVIHEALGGTAMPRPDLMAHLESKGIATGGQRGYHILHHLAQKGFLCLGPREGKQQTVVLLDEWAPESRDLSRDEALAEIATRYFQSHGPATLHDFAWWTGLTIADCRTAMDHISQRLEEREDEDRTLWFFPTEDAPETTPDRAMLLPFVDEYTVGYADRRDFLPPEYKERTFSGLMNVVVVDGGIVGMWTRRLYAKKVVVTLELFRGLDDGEEEFLRRALDRYGGFLGRAVEVEYEKVKRRL